MANERHISYLPYLRYIYIYLYTHIHLEFLFRSKLPTILNEWPYSRRACTSSENRLTQFTVRFHGTIVNRYDSMPFLFLPSSTLIALSLSICVDYPTRKRETGDAGIGFVVDGALFRSSVNNEACKYALWTPRQIASVSTKACDTRGRADTDRASNSMIDRLPFNSVYSTKLIRKRPTH